MRETMKQIAYPIILIIFSLAVYAQPICTDGMTDSILGGQSFDCIIPSCVDVDDSGNPYPLLVNVTILPYQNQSEYAVTSNSITCAQISPYSMYGNVLYACPCSGNTVLSVTPATNSKGTYIINILPAVSTSEPSQPTGNGGGGGGGHSTGGGSVGLSVKNMTGDIRINRYCLYQNQKTEFYIYNDGKTEMTLIDYNISGLRIKSQSGSKHYFYLGNVGDYRVISIENDGNIKIKRIEDKPKQRCFDVFATAEEATAHRNKTVEKEPELAIETVPEEKEEEPVKPKGRAWVFILIMAMLLLISILLHLYRRKRKKREEHESFV